MKSLILYIVCLLLSYSSLADTGGYIAASAVFTNNISLAGSNPKGQGFGADKIDAFIYSNWNVSSSTIRAGIGLRDEPGLDAGKLEIRYLLWDIPYNIENGNVGIRIGRVPHNLGYFNKLRNNPREGEFIYLPAGIYREQFKWLAMSGDGIQVYLNKGLTESSDISIYSTFAKPSLDHGQEILAGHTNDLNSGILPGKDSWVKTFNIEYSYSNITLHYDYTYLDWKFLGNRLYGPFMLPDGDLGTKVHTIGLRYYCTEDFDITTEYLQVDRVGNTWEAIKQRQQMAGALGHPEGYVLSIRKRFGDDLQVTLSTTRYSASSADKYGRKLSSFSGIPAKYFYTTSNSISTNYKLTNSWSIRNEYTQGRGIDSFVVGVQDASAEEHWKYFATQLIYSF